MNITKQLDFIVEEGTDTGKELTVFALSTCGFCKSALRFLRKNNLAFKYLYIDHIETDIKKKLKAELQETYGERPMYPFLLIGEEDHLVGFNQESWSEKLGLDSSETDKNKSEEEIKDDELTKARKFATMVASHQGWRLHRDNEFFNNLVDGLRINKERYGYYLCPCRLGEGDQDADKDIICPCEYSKPDISEFGHCFCSLYQSPEFYFSGKTPSSIPERRPE